MEPGKNYLSVLEPDLELGKNYSPDPETVLRILAGPKLNSNFLRRRRQIGVAPFMRLAPNS